MKKKLLFISLFPILFSSFIASIPAAADEFFKGKNNTLEEIAKFGRDAFIYGYPLVLMDITKNVSTAVSEPMKDRAPVNQFGHLRQFPTPDFKAVVSPNADTLYSTAWLDLSTEPMILSVPNTNGRFYMMPILDAWTNVIASPGARTTGTDAANFAIVGPNWRGTIPDGIEEFRSPTNLAWIIGRILTTGPEDFEAVNALQDQLKLTPLSSWGQKYVPPTDVSINKGIDTETPPVKQIAQMDAVTFFERLGVLLGENPPLPQDERMIDKLAQIGVIPGQGFSPESLTPKAISILEESVKSARQQIVKKTKNLGQFINGWQIIYDLGDYGDRYLERAAVALVGLGANLAKDAIYPIARIDGNGRPLTGAYRYVLHFEKDQIPPVNGFWSLTMYNNDQFFVENPINRYAIGNRDDLKFNPDGSLDLYIQHENPGSEKVSNWLPAPADGFNVIMRLYWPKEQVLNKEWVPPVIQRILKISKKGI